MDAITWRKVPNWFLGGYTLELRIPGHEVFKRTFTDQELDGGVPELEEARRLFAQAAEAEGDDLSRPGRSRVMMTGKRTGKMHAFRLRCEGMRRLFPSASDALPA